MNLVNKWVFLFTVGCVLGAQTFDDPVMKARLQRSQAQGIEETDLPPAPRAVLEPPPLPPPELHVKDSPHAKVAKTTRRRGGKGRAAKGAAAAAPAAAQAPVPKTRSAKHARPAGKVAKPARKKAKA